MAGRLADAPLMRVLVALRRRPDDPERRSHDALDGVFGVGIHSPGEDPGTEKMHWSA